MSAQEFTLESLHDWTIALDHAHCLYDDPGDGRIILYVEEIHHYAVTAGGVDLSGAYIVVDWDTGKVVNAEHFHEERFECSRFIWEHPPVGYINHQDRAYYLVRKPRRQWRRGFSRENYYSLGEWHSNHLGSNKAVASMYAKKMETIPKSYEQVLSGELRSRAFADNYAMVAWSQVPDTVCLEYKGRVIGIVDDDLVAHIPSSVDFLREELSQYLEVNLV